MLPKSLRPEHLLKLQMPNDTTLAQSKAMMMASDSMKELKNASRYPDHVSVRFVDDDGKELPDSMTLKEFQKLARANKASIAISDGEGGALV